MVYTFRFDDCNTLVFYAVRADDDEPDAAISTLVPNTIGSQDVFVADIAPYLTMLDREQFEDELTMAGHKAQGDALKMSLLREVQTWFESHDAQWILYQLEPPLIAGDGTARARGLAAERSR